MDPHPRKHSTNSTSEVDVHDQQNTTEPIPMQGGRQELVPTETQQKSYPAIRHFLILSAFILPIAVIPFAVNRRSLVSLRRRVEELETNARSLQRNMETNVLQLAKLRDDNRRLGALLHQIKQESDVFRTRVGTREAEQQRSYVALKSDLQKLILESQRARTHAPTLYSLGASLADVAAFMDEVGLEVGYRDHDRKSVERLRRIALDIQNLARIERKETKG